MTTASNPGQALDPADPENSSLFLALGPTPQTLTLKGFPHIWGTHYKAFDACEHPSEAAYLRTVKCFPVSKTGQLVPLKSCKDCTL